MPHADKEFDIGFAISTPDQRNIEEEAALYAEEYGGSPELTQEEWDQINDGTSQIENRIVAWLSDTFNGATSEGHSDEELVGSMWVDPENKEQLDVLRSAEWVSKGRIILTHSSGSLTKFIDPCEGFPDKIYYLLMDVRVEFIEIPEELEDLL